MLTGRGHLHHAAFDLLWLNGKDLRRQPLTRRKRRLERRAYTQAEGRWELFQKR
jgi:ATP-dependent DNA ligase